MKSEKKTKLYRKTLKTNNKSIIKALNRLILSLKKNNALFFHKINIWLESVSIATIDDTAKIDISTAAKTKFQTFDFLTLWRKLQH